MKRNLSILLLAMMAAMVLGGCNTVEGAGKDIEAAYRLSDKSARCGVAAVAAAAGEASTQSRKIALGTTQSRVRCSAITLAERGAPSMAASSPKISPAPTSFRTSSRPSAVRS